MVDGRNSLEECDTSCGGERETREKDIKMEICSEREVGRNESQMSTGLAPVVVRSSPESSIIFTIRSGFFSCRQHKRAHTHTH